MTLQLSLIEESHFPIPIHTDGSMGSQADRQSDLRPHLSLASGGVKIPDAGVLGRHMPSGSKGDASDHVTHPIGQTAAPSQKHSSTSRLAAKQIASSADSLRRKVLDYLRGRPDGATDEEIQFALDVPGSTERPRRIELVVRHLVEPSGQTRETRSGRQATVWVAKENL